MMDANLYIAIPVFLLTGILFVYVGLGISRWLRPNNPTQEKLEPYECGEEAIGSSHVPFNSKFYAIALLFVLFEVELIFLFPTVIVLADGNANLETSNRWAWLALTEIIFFIIALGAGLIYAWKSGFLEWQIGGQETSDFEPIVPKSLYDQVNKRNYSPKPVQANDPIHSAA